MGVAWDTPRSRTKGDSIVGSVIEEENHTRGT